MKLQLLSTLMVITGFLSLLVFGAIYFFKNYQPLQQTSFERKTTPFTFYNASDTSPVRIVVGQTGIDLLVKIAPNYQFSDDKAIFIQTSQKIGVGNSVIYAHNWNSLFGKLAKVKVTDVVSVYLANGERVNYEVSQKHVVPPQTLSILKTTTDSRLTLFTCTGFLDKDRLVVIANQI